MGGASRPLIRVPDCFCRMRARESYFHCLHTGPSMLRAGWAACRRPFFIWLPACLIATSACTCCTASSIPYLPSHSLPLPHILQRSVHSRIYRHFPSLTLPFPTRSFLSQICNHVNSSSSPPTGGHGLLYRRRITGRIPPPSQSSHPCRCTLHLSWHTAMPHATDGNSLRIGCRHMRALWSARHAACWTV